MIQFSKIQSAPDYIVSSKASMPTVEERQRAELEAFRQDAGLVAVSAMASICMSAAMSAADIVLNSSDDRWRKTYQIYHDYTKDVGAVIQAQKVRNVIVKYGNESSKFSAYLSRLTCIFRNGADAGECFVDRIDASDEEFAPYFDSIRDGLQKRLSLLKPADARVLYRLAYALFIAHRFDAVCRYVRDFSPIFRAGESLCFMTYLRVAEPLKLLLRSCCIKDWTGRPFYFVVDDDDRAEYEKARKRNSWRRRYADSGEPVLVNIGEIFSSEDMSRLAYNLDSHLFELKTIDSLTLKAEGKDPEYRKDYKYKRLQSCASSYEQAMLNSDIFRCRWKSVVDTMPKYLQWIKARSSKPVVGFHFQKQKLSDGSTKNKGKFLGVWNSAYEASNELGVPTAEIKRCLRDRFSMDKFDNIWFSIEDYCSMLAHRIEVYHPELSEDFNNGVSRYIVLKSREQMSEEARADDMAIDSSGKAL